MTGDTGISISLARVEVQLARYLEIASRRDRKDLLADIGKELSAIKERLPVTVAAGSAHVPNALSTPRAARSSSVRGRSRCDAPITMLPGVGDKNAKKLTKLGLETVGDVLRFLPRRHIDYSKTMTIREAVGFDTTGEVTVKGIVKDEAVFDGPPARYTIRLADATGSIKVTWFNKFLAHQIRAGDEITISGKLEHGYGMPTATSPEWEKTGAPNLSTGRLDARFTT